ncbi:DUF488 domain-containing protein [Aeromicrobium terrae]|uniref:DUF488 family protein n=1 Tax=Aeromicrobium terrae TaxID=2498846 RepID=A0A5C8NM51_9ACTN|nr:DUF488 family protein [Aeromicrobium terrae]TXL62924.1 DUF488 family protein [Aeromicrobium terrae]
MDVRVRRVYDEPEPGDGTRVLVDRLWPRGLSKDAAALDHWLRDIAPSTELRHWFDHTAERRAEFEERYRAELEDDDHAPPLAELRALAETGPVTLLTATKDLNLSHAPILREVLRGG